MPPTDCADRSPLVTAGDGHSRPQGVPLSDDVLVWLLAKLDSPPPSGTPLTREELMGELFEWMRYDRRSSPTTPTSGYGPCWPSTTPAAPPVLLLRCYLEYSCCGRDLPGQLPRLPTEGLARFANDSDPAVRRLAALDPQADPTLVNRLTTDPEATVQHPVWRWQAARACR